MNETILNGLLNLFAIFASLAKIESDQARQAVNSYLTSHFGIRSHLLLDHASMRDHGRNHRSYLKRYKVFTMTRSSTSIEKALLLTYATSSSPN